MVDGLGLGFRVQRFGVKALAICFFFKLRVQGLAFRGPSCGHEQVSGCAEKKPPWQTIAHADPPWALKV